MRKIVAALQSSVDGFIEGPDGSVDWVNTWEDHFNLSDRIDACVLGRGMYSGYEQYWRAIVADPSGVLPFGGGTASPAEVEYAHFADRTPHFVLSTTLTSVDWPTARVIRSIDDISRMKQQSGSDIYAIGGAAFISSLMNADLIDEIGIVVHPVILGGGKSPFTGNHVQQTLELVDVKPMSLGRVGLSYSRITGGH